VINVQVELVQSLTDTATELIQANLRNGVKIRFAVPTRSMLPILAPGDRVIARGTVEQPRVGEIAIVKTGQKWLAHRVIERRAVGGKCLFVTKGDNCIGTDEIWSAEAFCGIITSVQRDGREVNFDSKRARGLGIVLAHLSRWQSRCDQMRSTPWKNIAFKATSVVMRSAALLAQVILGLKWVRGV
jgi:signal peptidase I